MRTQLLQTAYNFFHKIYLHNISSRNRKGAYQTILLIAVDPFVCLYYIFIFYFTMSCRNFVALFYMIKYRNRMKFIYFIPRKKSDFKPVLLQKLIAFSAFQILQYKSLSILQYIKLQLYNNDKLYELLLNHFPR